MQAVIEVNPKKLGGVPCFAGTRVPVAYLFMHMAHGGTVDSFVEDYDSVSRDLARKSTNPWCRPCATP